MASTTPRANWATLSAATTPTSPIWKQTSSTTRWEAHNPGMEAFVVIALIRIGLLAAELLLPTGGTRALLGIAGLVVGGILALGSDSNSAEWIGGALITLAILSAISFFYITR